MVYLDYNATTPVDRRVVDAMVPSFEEAFANPSSTHRSGAMATRLVDDARRKVAGALDSRTADVVFTSGATEANNLALAGLRAGLGRSMRVLAGATEHKSVLETCSTLESEGSAFRKIPVLANGTLDLAALEALLSDGADVVSVMAANSETGVIHPVRDAARLAHEYGSLFHCDATQVVGKIPFAVSATEADMVTLSSHKIYGPKGCGALVATREARRMIAPILHGGGQERNLRSGTPNVTAIVGFGEACRIATTEGLVDSPRQGRLRDSFEYKISLETDAVSVNGADADRLPNTSNVRIHGALADAVAARLPTVEISTGSACSSATMEPSHVLVAMGLGRAGADESIRVSTGRRTTDADIDRAVSEIVEAATFVRGIESRSEMRRSS